MKSNLVVDAEGYFEIKEEERQPNAGRVENRIVTTGRKRLAGKGRQADCWSKVEPRFDTDRTSGPRIKRIRTPEPPPIDENANELTKSGKSGFHQSTSPSPSHSLPIASDILVIENTSTRDIPIRAVDRSLISLASEGDSEQLENDIRSTIESENRKMDCSRDTTSPSSHRSDRSSRADKHKSAKNVPLEGFLRSLASQSDDKKLKEEIESTVKEEMMKEADETDYHRSTRRGRHGSCRDDSNLVNSINQTLQSLAAQGDQERLRRDIQSYIKEETERVSPTRQLACEGRSTDDDD